MNDSTTATATQEWEALGDTLRHVAQLPNPTTEPQRGYVDGYREAEGIHRWAGADGWQEFKEQLANLKEIVADMDYTPEYVTAYVASLNSILGLVRASTPDQARKHGVITIKDLHTLERGMDADSPDEELAMKIATGVVANAMHNSTALDEEMVIETHHAEKVLADHRAYLTSNPLFRGVMTSEQLAAYDEMARKIIAA